MPTAFFAKMVVKNDCIYTVCQVQMVKTDIKAEKHSKNR